MDYASAVPLTMNVTHSPSVMGETQLINSVESKLKQVLAASQQLVALRDSHEVCMVTLAHVTDLLDIHHAAIWSWEDSSKQTLYCRSASTQTLKNALSAYKLGADEGVAGWVANNNKCGLFYGQDTDLLNYKTSVSHIRFESVLAIPLHVGGDVDSVLEIFSPKQQFTPEEIELADTLAKSAALALENAQLVEALRSKTNELETRNEELDAFAHTVAHDLRTPLNWVNGYIELLIKDWEILENEERVEYARATHHGAQMMSNIIDELLLLASLHDADIVYSSVDMDSVLQSAHHRLEPMLRQYSATLTIPQGYPIVRGYGPWIEGVWVNYISNAIKYGGTPAHIEVGYDVEPERVLFWVQDNGQGLSEEQQLQLFIPFSGSGKKRGKGHGLGLSIVRRIVEKLGGEVSVKSAMGEGSRFIFALPRA